MGMNLLGVGSMHAALMGGGGAPASPDYTVVGATGGSAGANGDYYENGTLDGNPKYDNDASAYSIMFDSSYGAWFIHTSDDPDNSAFINWYSPATPPEGLFDANTGSGTPFVIPGTITDVAVSGAGTVAVNGTYSEFGTQNNLPTYKHATAAIYLWSDFAGYWYFELNGIELGGTTYYYGEYVDYQASVPWAGGTVYIVAEGDANAPTVVEA